jgi:hypothetical protein
MCENWVELTHVSVQRHSLVNMIQCNTPEFHKRWELTSSVSVSFSRSLLHGAS